MNTSENQRTLQAMLVPLAEGDARPFVAGMAEDIQWTVTGSFPWAGTFRGKDALRKELFAVVMARFKPPYRVTIKRILTDGDYATVELQGVGNTTHDGLAYPQEYCWVCRLADGKLKEVAEYGDTYLAMRVLGEPPDKSPSAS